MLVTVKEVHYKNKMREITREMKIEMNMMRQLRHDNINNFLGKNKYLIY